MSSSDVFFVLSEVENGHGVSVGNQIERGSAGLKYPLGE